MYWRWKDEDKVIYIGEKFCVAPPWLKTDRIKISLVEGLSFGTGVHETTVSCIEVMEKICLKGKTVLDIGIGSGILSVAAVKLGAKRAIGFDIEKDAIRECIMNAKLNATPRIDCFVGSSSSSVKGQFDIVLANIFADVILRMKNDISIVTKDGGYLLLSGIVVEENFTVKGAFVELGFKVVKNMFLEDYSTILLKKEG